jgi:hypothetical protein
MAYYLRMLRIGRFAHCRLLRDAMVFVGSLWEIRIATEKDDQLSTCRCDQTPPPEYLLPWPVFSTLAELVNFARLMATVRSRTVRMVLSERKSADQAKTMAAAEFHSELERRFDQ